jgi:hypothetical protein
MVGISATSEGTIVKSEKENATIWVRICDHCKNVMAAEAVSKKRQIEKEGAALFSLDRSIVPPL